MTAPEVVGRRLGVLGGSFDPVHLAHLIAAQDAFERMELDRVIFMPTSHAPLKERPPGVSDAKRIEMLFDALGDDPRFEISTQEIARGGVSYSIDTARALQASHPADKLYWIIGTDQALRIGQWREIEALAAMVEFVVLARPGYPVPTENLPPGVNLHPISAHVCEISSSEIRERIASGRPVDLFLPAAVAERISQERLYQ